jgi:predicted MFS family arabinose efflux permease
MNATTARNTWDLYTPRQRWTYLAILFLVSTSNYVDRNVISVLLEPIKHEFGISDTLLGLLTGISFALFYATLGIPVARWADRGDRKLIITLSLVTWSIMTVVCGLAQSFWQLALARIGVGAGEAGALPPAQSLIADYFNPAQRARALAVFVAAATAGYLIGFIFGAQIAASHGWRMAFIVMGAPGLILACVVYAVLREPRHLPEFRPDPRSQEPLKETLRILLTKRSFVHLLIGMVIYFMISYGAVVFFPSYMIRVLNVPLATVGFAYGTVAAVSAIVGTVCGGFLTDRLALRSVSWLAWIPAIGFGLCWLVYQAMLSMPTFTAFLALSAVAGVAANATVPAMFSALHAVCGSPRRAMAVALAFFFANLIGLGLGPVVSGAMSDALSATYGAVGLRYALMVVLNLLLAAAWFMYLCGRHLPGDVEA